MTKTHEFQNRGSNARGVSPVVPQPDYVRGPFKVYLRSDGVYSIRDERKSFGADAESMHCTLREATAACDALAAMPVKREFHEQTNLLTGSTMMTLEDVQDETGIETLLPGDYSAELAKVEAGAVRAEVETTKMAGDMSDTTGLMTGFDSAIDAVRAEVSKDEARSYPDARIDTPSEPAPKVQTEGWEEEEPW